MRSNFFANNDLTFELCLRIEFAQRRQAFGGEGELLGRLVGEFARQVINIPGGTIDRGQLVCEASYVGNVVDPRVTGTIKDAAESHVATTVVGLADHLALPGCNESR